jgi:uncharacterized protein YbcI
MGIDEMPPSSPRTRPDPRRHDAITLAISEEVAEVHARSFGRRPVEVKTLWHEEFVVCVLEGVFTDPERALVDAGRFDRVRGDRQSLRDVLEPTLRALVETLTEQSVRAYMSEISPDDVAFESFVLGPPNAGT